MTEMTDRQKSYLISLLNEREMTDEARAETRRRIDAGEIDKDAASRYIERALALPKIPGAAPASSDWSAIPAGRYAVEHDGTLKFYEVDKPTEGKWAGYTFLSVRASDERYPIKNGSLKKEIMNLIARDPKEAGIRFGREIGACCVCSRSLTNEISRRLGIGPVCGERNGWLTREAINEVRDQIKEEGADPDAEDAA